MDFKAMAVRLSSSFFYDKGETLEYIKKNYEEVVVEESADAKVVGVTFVDNSLGSLGKIWCYKVWFGRSKRPFHENRFFFSRYGNQGEINRDREYEIAFSNTVDISKQRDERNKKNRDERKNYKHNIEVGDIFLTSWGYDQTNVDFYEVIGVLDKSVVVVEVGQKMIRSDRGSEYVVPDKRAKGTKKFRCVVRPGGGFKVDGHYASKWDGKPEYQTASGYGH